jgi:hypothetical protein
MGPDNFEWGADEMIFAILLGFKGIRNEAPLFEVYLPDYAACYDKVLQPAIFKEKFACTDKIKMNDVAWWDCLSDECELYQKPIRMFIEAEMPTKRKGAGRLLVDNRLVKRSKYTRTMECLERTQTEKFLLG